MLHAATTSLHTACHPPARYTHCSQNVAPAFIWRTCTLAAVRACKFMCVCVCACACVVGVSTRTNECVRIVHRFEPLSAHERLHVRLCARTPQRARAPVQVYSCLSTRACAGAGEIAVQVTVCAQFVGWSARITVDAASVKMRDKTRLKPENFSRLRRKASGGACGGLSFPFDTHLSRSRPESSPRADWVPNRPMFK